MLQKQADLMKEWALLKYMNLECHLIIKAATYVVCHTEQIKQQENDL